MFWKFWSNFPCSLLTKNSRTSTIVLLTWNFPGFLFNLYLFLLLGSRDFHIHHQGPSPSMSLVVVFSTPWEKHGLLLMDLLLLESWMNSILIGLKSLKMWWSRVSALPQKFFFLPCRFFIEWLFLNSIQYSASFAFDHFTDILVTYVTCTLHRAPLLVSLLLSSAKEDASGVSLP